MHLHRLVVPVLATGLIAGMPALAIRPAHAAGLTGQWRFDRSAACSTVPARSALCSSLVGLFASRSDWLNAIVDSQGAFTFVGGYRLIGTVAGASSICAATVFSQPFNGTCQVDVYGSGVIKPGATGLPDFWITDETATAYNGQPAAVHNPRGATAYPIDTGVPAISGLHATQQSLEMLRLLSPGTPPPAGVYLQVTVSQRQAADQREVTTTNSAHRPASGKAHPVGGSPAGDTESRTGDVPN